MLASSVASNAPAPHKWRVNSLHVLLLFTLLSLLLTWPLLTRFTTHVPGDSIDDPALAWNLWWVKTRLVDQLNFDIFHCDWMFFPIQINLGFYTLTPLNGLLSIPLQTAASLVVASNLLLLSSFVLSGLGMYLLARQELRSRTDKETRRQGDKETGRLNGDSFSPSPPLPLSLSALFAALVYAFASSKLFYASLGQFNIASSQWIPFCVLYVLRLGRSHTRRQAIGNGLMAGLFFTFQAWAELTFASFLLIFIAIWFVTLLMTRRARDKETRRQEDEAYEQHATRTKQSPLRTRYYPPRNRQFTIRNIQLPGILAFTLLATIGLLPFLWAMLPDLLNQGDFFSSGGGFADLFSADLAGYLLPTRLHPLLGDWIRTLPFQNGKGQQIFLGYSVFLLAVIGVITTIRNPQSAIRNSTRFWLTTTLLFFLLTLGPHLRWMGQDLPIPGPFALVSQLPFFSGNRYPSRYAVMLLLGMAMLAAHGMLCLLRTIHLQRTRQAQYATRLLLFSLTLVFFFEHLSLPLPLSDLRVPSIYQRIAQTAGDFTVLELPTGWRNGAQEIGRRDVLFMMQQWYQTTHGKRRLAGNTSRNPAYKFQYFSEAPLVSDLIALMNADQWWMKPEVDRKFSSMVQSAKSQSSHILDFLNVRFITVHVEKSTPQLLQFIEEALPVTLIDTWQGTDWSGAASTIRLYEVNNFADASAALPSSASESSQSDQSIPIFEYNSPLRRLYLAEGWSSFTESFEAVHRQATLMLDLPDTGGKMLVVLHAQTGVDEFWLNGVRLEFIQRNPGWYNMTIPSGVANQPVDHLEIRFSQAQNLKQISPGFGKVDDWRIGSMEIASNISLAVRSAGLDVGGFAHIYLWGKEVARNQRGYNLAAISANGDLLDSVVFDTFGNCNQEPLDERASQAMAAWLRQWPTDTFIAGAAADEASCRLEQTAVDGLRTIGVSGDLRGRFRWGHAFIGMVGAQAGEAIESMALLQPAEVRAGGSSDGQYEYGVLGRVEFRPANTAGK